MAWGKRQKSGRNVVEKNQKLLAESKADATTLLAFTTGGSDTVLVSRDTSDAVQKDEAVEKAPSSSPAAQTPAQLALTATVFADQRTQKSADLKALAKGKGAKDPNKVKLGAKKERKEKKKDKKDKGIAPSTRSL